MPEARPAPEPMVMRWDGNMPSQPRNLPEQEHSIKARANELFVEEAPIAAPTATKPFEVYLRETPAQPVSPAIKVILWILGFIVVVLLLMALWRVSHRHAGKPPAGVESAQTVDALPPENAEPSGTR
jgi:hypothetical protein